MERPERVDRLILNAFTYTGRNSPTLEKRAEQLPYFRSHNRRLRDRAMIQSIFTRDQPGTTDPAVPAGASTVISPSDTTTTEVPAAAPKSTAVAPVKPVPVTLTVVPPPVGPPDGLTALTVGAPL